MIGSIMSGIINAQADLPTADLSALFGKIHASGENEKALINELPNELKPLYEQYKASLGAAGTTLQGSTDKIGSDLLAQTKANYDPNSAAVQATLAALKQQDYSTLPGTVSALKGQLAGMGGGLSTGGAAKAVTNAVMAPAAAYSQQAANTEAQQLNAQQVNVQNALNTIAQMDDNTARQLFGMSTQEAQTILTTGRQDLQNQLADLIAQSTRETNQTLGLLGYQANEGKQNAITRNAQDAAITNDFGSALDNMITYGGSSLQNNGNSVGGAQAVQSGLGSVPTGDNADPARYGIYPSEQYPG